MKPPKAPARLPAAEIAARVIHNFVVKHRQPRYLGLVARHYSGGSHGFGELDHFIRNLDLRYCHQIPSGLQHTDSIFQQLQALTSANDCFIMHARAELDGQWMNLRQALELVVGSGDGAFLVLDNGEIMYHESETPKERYIGGRRPRTT
ncbi:hypothetical protein GCM10023185_21570 [Hymenobacter saemangeumensis]|uniref:Uncharacterized protein n=1 Tax=Hymenobacter saemangeumensis TaxID=1084522 RepID=A0ABP8IEY8_9BACT